MPNTKKGSHGSSKIGWLEPAVLGANDAIISIASLIVGVAAAGAPQSSILLTGAAGLVAGGMSLAASEYVSVQSEADTERANVKSEKRARPIQAALASLIFFSAGAIVPIAAAMLAPSAWIAEVTSATALVTLVILGGTAAYAGGASIVRGAMRVVFWGALAMGLTAAVGWLFGAVA